MTHFKVGQTVYYFRTDGQYIGTIITGKVIAANKNLATGQVTYKVESSECYWLTSHDLTADTLYSSYEKAFKEHKEELAYNALMIRIAELEKAVNRVFSEYIEKIQANPVSWATISVDNRKTSLYVEGIGNLQEEFNKLKTEVAAIKKKIKKPTKKTVTKKTSADKETPDDARNEK